VKALGGGLLVAVVLGAGAWWAFGGEELHSWGPECEQAGTCPDTLAAARYACFLRLGPGNDPDCVRHELNTLGR
jgi:hypothetical protein